MNWLIKKIVLALIARCERKKLFYNILGNNDNPKDVYLIRYFVLRSKLCNIYIHRFLRSDRDDLHDHPWHFATYLVDGAYTEVVPGGSNRRFNKNGVKINTLVFRKATDRHQVVVDKDLTHRQRKQAALTLFISGPIIREWGFWKKGKWIHWAKYLKKIQPKKLGKKEPWA